MDVDLCRHGFFPGAAGLATSGMPTSARAQPITSKGLLFDNVHIFDGTGAQLSPASNVLIVGNRIERISTAPIVPPAEMDVVRIDGGGRTLMPGLIDAQTHIMFATIPQLAILTSDIGFINVAAVKAANYRLMRGFTTIREMGGPYFGLKRGIHAGLVAGPRIWPSGAFIS